MDNTATKQIEKPQVFVEIYTSNKYHSCCLLLLLVLDFWLAIFAERRSILVPSI